METLQLPELIAGCRRGEHKAQQQLFRTYYGEHLKICLRYAADRPGAEAALSDAFFKIFTKIAHFREDGPFEAWMRRIVVNTCLTHVRNYSGGATQAWPEAGDAEPVGQSQQSVNEALSRLGIQELTKLIQSLPPVSRTVFNLAIFEGYSHKEIAAQLNISEGTSYWHLSSARTWLKSKL